MQVGFRLRIATFDRIAGIAAVLFTLSVGAPAWAGDGGADAGTLQSFLNTVCNTFSISPCPQLPTVTQSTLEIAGIGYARPEAIRQSQNVAPGSVFAGNPSPIAATPVVPVMLPVSPSDFTNLALTPLAFVSPGNPVSKGSAFAPPTQLFDPQANSFFYAATTYGNVAGPGGSAPQPQVLNLFYDDLLRTNRLFVKGQHVAKISLPLVVYDPACEVNPAVSCTETEVPAILDVHATCTGGPSCLAASALADFSAFGATNCGSATGAQPCTAADLGIGFALVFGASPTGSNPHAIFEVQAPLVVTVVNDPLHFNAAAIPSSQVYLIGTSTFVNEDLGFAPAFLKGKVVGIATYPAPMTVAGAAASNFGFCANLPDNGNGHSPRPAVAAFIDIATDGEALVSAPLGASTNPTLQCPF